MTFHEQERQAVLACRSVSKTYGSQTAVSDVTLDVAPGEVVGLLGANGAGKTTLMRMACGLVKPTAGAVRVLGEQPPYPPAVARQVGAALDTPAFYRWMTGPAQLRSLLHSSGLPDRGEPLAALRRVGLEDEARKRIRAYSQGMRQRLALAAALMRGPRLLVLDEPTNALDPHAVVMVRELIRREAESGTAVLVSSHQLDEVQRVCDRVVVMDRGTVVASGALDEIGLGGAESLEDWFFRISGHKGSW
ncbi:MULTISPECIES: ABC transporter ATP-binding protein [Streptomyces]|uniref:Putative ABC transporter ATP-binding protein YxlF n=1 Tax=Streptomyces rubrolavendulae TaxID=285473 RepID=A0A1D8G2A8_9ACTN|nr:MULTISPECIES: ABC transporter ATP-binding protein [Streptomyces]AOT59566.1 putative ABC transporter ATP-binding protein YxlF [Streptomyces rubrolavendulae]UQS31937.1 ABC transporter ATP-binding protein [Streptomyces fradiae]